MGLDFVLAHVHYRYLATEWEKVDYFSGTQGIRFRLSLANDTSLSKRIDHDPLFMSINSQFS